MSKYGVFSGPYFPVFGVNTGNYGPEKTPYLDIFHAILEMHSLSNIDAEVYSDPCQTFKMEPFCENSQRIKPQVSANINVFQVGHLPGPYFTHQFVNSPIYSYLKCYFFSNFDQGFVIRKRNNWHHFGVSGSVTLLALILQDDL